MARISTDFEDLIMIKDDRASHVPETGSLDSDAALAELVELENTDVVSDEVVVVGGGGL